MIAERQLTLTAEAPPVLPVLRGYQHTTVISVAEAWAAGHDRVLVVAPTGAGKTVIGCALMYELERRGRPVLFLCHREVLISQSVDALRKFGLDVGYIKAGYRENRAALIQVGSVQSLARRDWWAEQEFEWDTARPTLVLDEAHTTGWSTVVRDILEQHPRMRVVGLTATPWRLSKREAMGDVFQAVATAPFPAELIAAGYLVPPVYYGVASPPDLSKVRTRGGDFVEEDLDIVCNTEEMVRALIDDWQRLAPGELMAAFATSVAHAHHIEAEAKRRGLAVAAIDANTPLDERRVHYAALRRGDIRGLASVGVLSEGWDCPEVGCILLARPTKSRALFHQQIGRGLRIAPWANKEKCTIVDQSANVGRFGFIEDFASFILRRGNPAGEKEDKDADDEPSPETKQCPTCMQITKKLTPKCLGCGYLWPLPDAGRGVRVRQLGRSDMPVEDRVQLYRDLLKKAHQRRWKPEAAAVRYREVCGEWPERSWAAGAVLGMHPAPEQVEMYRHDLGAIAAEKGMAHQETETWVSRWLAAEGVN